VQQNLLAEDYADYSRLQGRELRKHSELCLLVSAAKVAWKQSYENMALEFAPSE